ncbi:MAG: EF-hand domain-containing protein [Isosphaeraceae bacterium]|nr:EF-hand domain-containing protein [Isosphaeraceae bacterium]
MRKIGTIGLSLAILAGGAVWAQQEKGKPQEKAQKGLVDLRELFQRLDANSDTVIERDEVPASARDRFDDLLKRGDANKNGKLEAEEMRDLAQKLRALAGAGVAAPERFRQADKDGDGKLSRAEFPGQPALFDRLDADKDGFLTREEATRFAALGGPMPKAPVGKAARRLLQMDKDGDGKISRAEFTGPEGVFDRLDSNKDGFLTRDELPRGPAGKAQFKKKDNDEP